MDHRLNAFVADDAVAPAGDARSTARHGPAVVYDRLAGIAACDETGGIAAAGPGKFIDVRLHAARGLADASC